MQPIVSFKLSLTVRNQLTGKHTHCPKSTKVVEKALEQAAPQHRLAQLVEASLLQSPEGRKQIPAVDGRNEHWSQWLKSARVIPIQHVPAMLREASQRGQSLSRIAHEFRNGE